MPVKQREASNEQRWSKGKKRDVENSTTLAVLCGGPERAVTLLSAFVYLVCNQ